MTPSPSLRNECWVHHKLWHQDKRSSVGLSSQGEDVRRLSFVLVTTQTLPWWDMKSCFVFIVGSFMPNQRNLTLSKNPDKLQLFWLWINESWFNRVCNTKQQLEELVLDITQHDLNHQMQRLVMEHRRTGDENYLIDADYLRSEFETWWDQTSARVCTSQKCNPLVNGVATGAILICQNSNMK